jgi:DNA mismatch repair protein MutS2
MDRFSLKKLEFHKIKEMLEKSCSTPLGIPYVQELEPSSEAEEVLTRQAETTEACHALRLCPDLTFEGISDLTPSLRRAGIGGVLEPMELIACRATLRGGERLKKAIQRDDLELPHLKKLISRIQECSTVQEKIGLCIQDDGKILDKASPELGRLRNQIRILEERIRSQLDEILASPQWNRYLQEPIYTVRGDRYVLPVKQEYRNHFHGLVHDQSGSGATVFMEPMPLVRLANELVAKRSAARQEEIRILEELTGLVAAYHDEIQENLKLLGRLDFIFAKGDLSGKLKANPPRFSDEGRLVLRQGRHPLLKGDVVPLDIHLGGDFDCLIITGPNTGGKTVALKTVGLLVLMAQSGLHIPAGESTVLPFYQNVFADIGDEQSIEQSLSTFSGHMINIVRILEQAGEGSLVILDELGAGTDPEQGAALGMAILDTLINKGTMIIATSHFSELKVFAHTRPRAENASVEFDSKTLQPTYRLSIGIPGESNAFEIAERLGLDSGVIERARTFLRPEHRELSDLIQHLKEDQFAASSARVEAERLQAELESLKEKVKQEQEKLQEKQRVLLAKAHEEARELVRTARREAEQLIRGLKEEIRQADSRSALEDAQAIRRRLGDLTDRIDKRVAVEEEKFPAAGDVPETVSPGEAVSIPRFRQEGYVLNPPNADGEVLVQVGVLKLNLPLKELRHSSPKKEQQVQFTRTEGNSIERHTQVSPELDFRGLRVEDGLREVDKYLDTAYLAGLKKVSLIHGKGTGALRKAVQQYLSKHPFVASYRNGTYHEGGTGVTIVEFK